MQHRQADAEKAEAQQKAAVAAEREKVRTETQASVSGASTEELTSKHAEELKELETRLNEKHALELKKAAETAAAEARSQILHASADSNQDKATADALAKASEEFEAKLKVEIEAATERGRMESAAKSRIKDSQLTKVQSKVKELEARILEWKNSGLLPADATTSPTKPATAAAASTTTPAMKAAPQTASGLARKASMNNGTSSGSAAQVQLPAGRGRGGPGNRGARGAARGGAGRGAAPAAAAAAAAAAPASTSALSIAGAAGKRAREDGDPPGDDSGAKRLKPAEGAAAANAKPVTLRRPPAAP
jgi:nucleoprotein TPR